MSPKYKRVPKKIYTFLSDPTSVSFFLTNFQAVAIKKNTVRIVQTFFFRIFFFCKSGHILRKKGHMSPYLDNELLLVARTRQDYKKILPDCLHSAIASRLPLFW